MSSTSPHRERMMAHLHERFPLPDADGEVRSAQNQQEFESVVNARVEYWEGLTRDERRAIMRSA